MRTLKQSKGKQGGGEKVKPRTGEWEGKVIKTGSERGIIAGWGREYHPGTLHNKEGNPVPVKLWRRSRKKKSGAENRNDRTRKTEGGKNHSRTSSRRLGKNFGKAYAAVIATP